MSEPYYDLPGVLLRDVETTSPQAQQWFDRGLVWAYASSHGEAVRCFERALEHDPDLAIAHWGIACGQVGPNYNKAWDAFDPDESGRRRWPGPAPNWPPRPAAAHLPPNARHSSPRWQKRFPTDDPLRDEQP